MIAEASYSIFCYHWGSLYVSCLQIINYFANVNYKFVSGVRVPEKNCANLQ